MQTMHDYFKWLIGFNLMGSNIRKLGLHSYFIFQTLDKLAPGVAGVEGNWGICSHDSGDKIANSIYISCIIDSKQKQQTKSLSPGNNLLMVKTNFKKPLALLVCDNSAATGNCGFVNGNRAASLLQKGTDLMVYRNAIAMFKLLFIWDLDATNPPGWCYAASQILSNNPNNNRICWESDHAFGPGKLKAAC